MKLILFLLAASTAYGQFFGGNASKIRGVNVVGNLSATCDDGEKLTYVAANERFECQAGGGGEGTGLVWASFTSETTVRLTHSAELPSPYDVVVTCRQATTNVPLIPSSTAPTANYVDVNFAVAESGTCVVNAGGSGVTGTTTAGQVLYGAAGNTLASSAGFTFSDAANIRLMTLAGGSSQSTNALLDITNSAGSSHWLTVLGDGKVGIGTNAPSFLADFRGAQSILQLLSTTGTNATYGIINNTNGSLIIGVDRSAGGALITGSAAYSAVISQANNLPLYLGTNSTIRATVLGGGAVGIGSGNTAPTGTFDALDRTVATGATLVRVGSDGTNTSPTTTTLEVRAGTVQGSANLQEWKNNAGTVQLSVQNNGRLLSPGYASTDGDIQLLTGNINLGSGVPFLWSSTAAYNGSKDTSLSRCTGVPGCVAVGTGAAGSVAGTAVATRFSVGGTSSSFPSIDNSGTTLRVRLADGSADAPLTAASLIVTGAIRTGAGDALGWTGRTLMLSSTQGVLQLTNQTADNFDRLQFGGTSSSFPALKRSATGLIARLADDSADTWMQASYFTISNTAEPTCDSSTRGQVRMVQGGAGVADTVRVCKKDAGDAYAWTALY